MKLAPVHIRILLDSYVSVHPPKENAFVINDFTRELNQAGLIVRGIGLSDDKWVTTEKGNVFVQAMLNLPLPVWSMPNL